MIERFALSPTKYGQYIFPEIRRLEFTRSLQFGDYIAQNGECTSNPDAPCYFKSQYEAEAARVAVLTEAINNGK